MSSKRDYYEVLEISRTASNADLKKAYRKLAMKYHPDQNPDDAQAAGRFREITEAFQVLSSPDKRADYDRFGHEAPNMTGGFGGTAVDMGSMTDFFESIFGSVFGGTPTRRRQGTPGRDLQYDLTLTLEDVVNGSDVEVTIPRPVRCSECGGSGATKGSKPRVCPQCEGRGKIRLQQGIFAMSAMCNVCGGRGEVIRDKCTFCGGKGLEIREEDFKIHIPAGVDDGAVKVIEGKGEHGRGGAPNGDLHIMIHVKRHKVFSRKGNDLHGVVHVSYPQAVLGAQIEVPTIDGTVKMKIKPGTESGSLYRLRGKGVPFLKGTNRGDQHVHVDIDIPKKLTGRQQELIEELGKELGTQVLAKPQSFLDKMKRFFD